MFECFTHFMMIEHLYGETFEPPVSHMGHTPALANDRRPLKCKDGHICIQPVSRAASAKFMELGGIPNAYESERFLARTEGQPRRASTTRCSARPRWRTPSRNG